MKGETVSEGELLTQHMTTHCIEYGILQGVDITGVPVILEPLEPEVWVDVCEAMSETMRGRDIVLLTLG